MNFPTVLHMGLACLELASLLAEHLRASGTQRVRKAATEREETWVCLRGCNSRGRSSQNQMVEALGRQISIKKLFVQPGPLSKGLSCLSQE